MPRNASILERVAWGSTFAASAAALLTALGTSLLAFGLIRSAADRRLEEAAITLAYELDEGPTDIETIRAVQLDESVEMEHTDILFAVYDRNGQRLVGDPRLALPSRGGCESSKEDVLRLCRAESAKGLTAVVGGARPAMLPLLFGSALLAAVFAAVMGWLASRPISRFVIAPLLKLRLRIEQLDVDSISQADLGPSEGVIEVDALRDTIGQLVSRVDRALAQANRFAANAAHELRTPLTYVRAELELLAENTAEANLRADVVRAQQKLAELAALVEKLLILALPARVPNDAHEDVSLRDLFEDAVAALSAADRQRISVSEDDSLIRGDTILLGMMISNALANALKFGESVGICLVHADGHAVIYIDDDGPGIAGLDRERAFEPFFRSNDALRRRIPGHGLGLALIRHIAQAHGGDASFVDKPERGARLEIRLPAAEAA